MKQLCSECQKRPATFVLGDEKGHIKTDARHDLCRQCQRAQKESDRHTRVVSLAKAAGQ